MVYAGKIFLHDGTNDEVTVLDVSASIGLPISFAKDGLRIFFVGAATSPKSSRPKEVAIHSGTVRDVWPHLVDLTESWNVKAAIPSPDGKLVALVQNGNLYLADCEPDVVQKSGTKGQYCELTQITFRGGRDPRWRKGGRELEWSFADTYYRADVSEIIADAKFGRISDRLGDEIAEKARKIALRVPMSRAKGTLFLTHARIITMRGSEILPDATVEITDGLIKSIGDVSSVQIPTGANVLSLKGKTVVPGFIDVHAHLSYQRDIIPRNEASLLSYLAFGITTLRDPSNLGVHQYSYAEQIDAGMTLGPRIFGTRALIASEDNVESFKDAQDIALRQKRLGAIFLKIHTGYNRQQRQWVLKAATEAGLKVAAHYPEDNALSSWLDLSPITDGAASMEHLGADASDIFDDHIKLLAHSKVGINAASLYGLYGTQGGNNTYFDLIRTDPRVANTFAYYWRGRMPAGRPKMVSEENLPVVNDVAGRFLSKATQSGGRVAIGSHGEQAGVGLHWEMWAHYKAGISRHDVLRAATLTAAEIIGFEDHLGSLEVGKSADMIVLAGDPLVDITNTLSAEYVIKDGFVYEAITLDRKWPSSELLPSWHPTN
jgi:imidazolonepropionase-like amidohydrolase